MVPLFIILSIAITDKEGEGPPRTLMLHSHAPSVENGSVHTGRKQHQGNCPQILAARVQYGFGLRKPQRVPTITCHISGCSSGWSGSSTRVSRAATPGGPSVSHSNASKEACLFALSIFLGRARRSREGLMESCTCCRCRAPPPHRNPNPLPTYPTLDRPTPTFCCCVMA